MTLPQHFATPDQYFEECHQFCEEYQGLYNFPNTEILVQNALDCINIDNLDNIDIYEENFELESINDKFLKRFFGKLQRLQVSYNNFEADEVLEDIFDVPLSPKKKHEIVYLAREIKHSCEIIRCNTVVDFGSGLGYLDQLLFETTNFNVLGLECNENYYVSAKKRQAKYHENSKENVKYIRHTIKEDSSTNINVYLEDKFTNHGGFCITGLHACADLTIDAANIFLKMVDAKCVVLMACCYHRMAINGNRFRNFPVSNCMRNIYEKYEGFKYMNVPFLRLGAQPSSGCEKLQDSVFNLMARAVLELYAQKHNCKLKRNKRKAVKVKSMDNNFDSYMNNARIGFTLVKNISSGEVMEEFDLEELKLLWSTIKDAKFKRAGIYVLLQNYLQPVIENIILFDRLVYLRENGVVNCIYKKVFNEKLSPRCLALLAWK